MIVAYLDVTEREGVGGEGERETGGGGGQRQRDSSTTASDVMMIALTRSSLL